jgi:hypothetical protein
MVLNMNAETQGIIVDWDAQKAIWDGLVSSRIPVGGFNVYTITS